MAKGRKTGGRQVGSLNKATTSLREAVDTITGEPIPVILARIGMIAYEAKDYTMAINALSKAAGYTYANVRPAQAAGTGFNMEGKANWEWNT